MPKPNIGHVVWVPPRPGEKQGHYKYRLRCGDGSRPWFHLEPGPRSPEAEKRAKERAAAAAQRVQKEGLVATPQRGEKAKEFRKQRLVADSGEAWWEAYFEVRNARGYGPVLDLYEPHIKPVLGDKHPREWTPADCELLRDTLDDKIRAGFWSSASGARYRFGWKRAWNVWSLFTSACKTTCRSKDKRLRVRGDNPCADVEPPDRGEKKRKQWLYPNEFIQLVASEDVPLRWRRLYAILTYTYLRANELTPLEWSDVNLDAGLITVNKAWEHKRNRVGRPKTEAGIRTVPIEPSLMPLLTALHASANGEGKVFPWMPPIEDWAAKFRLHLKRAGVKRAALFEDTPTTKRITLHDLRATGITWRCLRKDYGADIQRAAGHESYDTTDGYIREAGVFSGRVGQPFPTLPSSLIDALKIDPRLASRLASLTPNYSKSLRPQRESNPCYRRERPMS